MSPLVPGDHLFITVIVPTFDNHEQVRQMINSFLEQTGNDHGPYFRLVIIDNSDKKGHLRSSMSPHPLYEILEPGENLGWEGGLSYGLAHTPTTPLVMFANDDIHIVPGHKDWLWKMVETLVKYPDVAAVGPMSNFVMGYQNMVNGTPPAGAMSTNLLIGFCVLMRREALDDIGGVVTGLPGGDDFDYSLRYLAKGYRLAIQTDSYVHHWGCQTGARVHPGYWNSDEMICAVREELIRRHGFINFHKTVVFTPSPL